MLIGIKGLVLKTVERTDSDRLIVLFTVERGKIAVCAKGTRSAKSKFLPSIEPFSYSEFVLYEKDGFFWIKEAVLIENFYSIREDVTKLALASYICEVLDITVYENMQEHELLRLGLNSLYAIASDLRSLDTVKAVFEMRAAMLLGFAPSIEQCSKCGKSQASEFYFSLPDSDIVCSKCREKAYKEYMNLRGSVNSDEEIRFASQIFRTSEDVRLAISYIINCPADKIYGFTMPDEELVELYKLCEEHLIYQLEKKPKTLDFYKDVSAL
ncbi:MAG: DNA repair protein RecO [Ruminococcaceae bacterium]|nr:DNA repair protein RecO [Oscillospiraceae bacterium]